MITTNPPHALGVVLAIYKAALKRLDECREKTDALSVAQKLAKGEL